ncbi:ATP-dependent DNA helicase [Weissella confusa]|uniref:ATP-dependent DNA helicase n=1 Tax=Weissella confusa TaxID=1583 RepID=UPI0022E5054D|nr:ATP-dependent RecD-like DNA helicase [Weissella confusa]
MARFPEEQTEMYFWRHKLPEQIYEKNSFANLMAHTPESEMKAFAHEIFEKLPPELQNQQDYDQWLLALLEMLQQPHDVPAVMQQLIAGMLADDTLTAGQHEVWQDIADTPTPIQIVTGRAGSGKSYMMARLIRLAQQGDVNTILITPTHAAATNARGLVERAIGDLLDEHEPEYLLKPVDHVTIATATSFTYRNHEAMTEIARLGHFFDDPERAARYPTYDLMIVDEAFASNVRALIDAILYGLATGSQILLVGDPNQLPSVENDPVPMLNALVLAGLANRTPVLQQIKRANSPIIATVANAILDGDSSTIVAPDELISAEVLPEVFLTRPYTFAPMSETALLQVVETVKRALIAEPENETVVLVPTNELRRLINAAVQNALVATPVLRTEVGLWVRDDLTLYPGDRVQVMQTVYVTNQASGAREKVRMRGGDRITVVDVMPDYDMVLVQTVDTADPILVDLNETSQTGFNPFSYGPKLVSVRENLDLGYATTIHKIQGFTLDNVIVVLPMISKFITTNLIYSAVTRAANHLAIVAFANELQQTLDNHVGHDRQAMRRVQQLITETSQTQLS